VVWSTSDVSVLRNPVVLFLATGLLALAVIVFGTAELSARTAADEAEWDALETTELLAHSVAEPAIPRGLVDGDPGAIDQLDREVLERLKVTDVDRVKIWNAQGRVLYSDETRLIGQTFALSEARREVLTAGRSEADVSRLNQPENQYERTPGGLLEVYTLIESPEGEPLLFEVYYSAASIESRQDHLFDQFRPITLISLGLVVLVATVLLFALTRRLRRSAEERERLIRAAADASDGERVRIARDLHDGVVQDLAGAAFAVSAVARNPGLPESMREGLSRSAESLRTSLRGLRSLMVEIYPPDLHAEGLDAALDDLLAPAATQGVAATARVKGIDGVPDDTVALVWRVAQEAVRNALRHSGAEHLTVTVDRNADGVVLEVTDDGRGFDPTRRAAGDRFGLRGLSSLIAEAGGDLAVRSSPGAGTTIRLQMAGGPR
jgi:two-component system, NarL family, sensor kinase